MLYDAASPLKYIFYAVIGGLTLKPFVIPEESGIRAPGSRRNQGGESPPPGDARSWKPKVTASPRGEVESNPRRTCSP